jgi:hypothetical protein
MLTSSALSLHRARHARMVALTSQWCMVLGLTALGELVESSMEGRVVVTILDEELVKTKLTLNDVGGNPMEAQGVISMELTVGSKLLATTFFVVKV